MFSKDADSEYIEPESVDGLDEEEIDIKHELDIKSADTEQVEANQVIYKNG